MPDTHTPRKRFGQHFLNDETILQKMVAAIRPKTTESLVEIGPGQGALTQHLINRVKRLDAIEIDRDLASWLMTHFNDTPHFHCHQNDILKFDLKSLEIQKNLRIVGNLPYNISSPLLFKLFKDIDRIKDMFFLLQKEVVDRLVAPINSTQYNRLSVMSQYFCDSVLLFEVPPQAFTPPPKVNSAFVCMRPSQRTTKATHFNHFELVVRQAFCYRRKKISNCLKKIMTSAELEAININPQLRPQQLSVDDYITIANAYKDPLC